MSLSAPETYLFLAYSLIQLHSGCSWADISSKAGKDFQASQCLDQQTLREAPFRSYQAGDAFRSRLIFWDWGSAM